jgi:hypothetical protein
VSASRAAAAILCPAALRAGTALREPRRRRPHRPRPLRAPATQGSQPGWPGARSNSRRVTSWTGWPISCRHRGSTGIACRLETSQGCSSRITRSGPPSRHSPSGMSASGEMPRLMGMRSADMRRAEMPPPTAATHATNRPPTTPPGLRGRNSWRGWGGVFFCVPGVWWRHPTQRRRPAGAGPLRTGGSQAGEGQDGFARVKLSPGTSRRTARAAARVTRPRATRRLGRARSGPLSTGQSFRDG